MLSDHMGQESKSLTTRNTHDALKIILAKTPLGTEEVFAKAEISEKTSRNGEEKVSLVSVTRVPWENPEPLVVLYSLYKFAEKCGDYYQFTLTRLLNHQMESDGVSPTEIFGLDRDTMEKILSGLTINYPEYINATFTLDLDNINLESDKTAVDVLTLF